MKAFYSDFALYRRLLYQAQPYWPHTVSIFLISLLATPLALLNPLPLKIAVDSVLGSEPIPGFLDRLLTVNATHSKTAVLFFALGLLVVIALLSQLQVLADWLLQTYTGEKLVLDFRAMLFHHVQRLSLSYHDYRGTADSIYRIQHDAPAIQEIAIYGLIPLVTSAITLAAMISVTARIDWQLALVAMTVAPLYFVLVLVYRQPLRSRWREVTSLESSAMSVVQEVLTAVRIVKAFGKEDQEKERFVRRSQESMWARIRASFAEGHFGFLIGLTTTIGTVCVLFIGIRHVQAGTLTLGQLLLVIGYLTQLYGPVKTISTKAAGMQSQLARAERAFLLLDEAPDVPDKQNGRTLLRALGAVQFRDVSFGYGKDRPVLHSISFKVDPGTRLGIVGMTGAGKSTLVSLLTRFYDPTEGQILLDGIDLRQYKLADLRNQFAIVLQDPVLFSATILENIAYARPNADEEEVIKAAKAANAHEFIVRLPEGYNTPVGERGMTLSGGERQRIALARAFLKDAPILILDEPTSSVDLETESVIMEASERLIQGRTAFMIAHRVTTLTKCDVLLEIDDGRVSSTTLPMEQRRQHP
ncbi:ABC transporter ATP-binding protein [bacterium]|nr:MAG: ABC transporter ATP-binding protein [bacterium]